MCNLALSASIEAAALPREVARLQTVQAQAIRSNGGNHLIMWQQFKAGTGIEWVFLGLAQDAVVDCFGDIRSKGCNGSVDWRPLGGVYFIVWDLSSLRRTGLGGLGSKVKEFQ